MQSEFQKMAEAIAKSGELTAGSLNIGGTLRPEQATRVIDLLVDGSDILKRVTVERSRKLKKEVDVFSIGTKVLTRVPQGQDPTEFVSQSNVGPTLDMKSHQLFGRVLFDALRDNKDDPRYESKVLNEWIKVWARDITRLAFTGTHDDYDITDVTKKIFEHLNIGWPALLKASASSHKVDIADYTSNGVVDRIAYLGACVRALPDEYRSEDCKILMPSSDHLEYQDQIGEQNGGVFVLVTGGVKQRLSYEILPQRYMTSGEVIFCPLANLVYGVNTEIERYREVKGSKRCVDYTFDAADDFQIALPDAAVIGYAVPAQQG
ncbi:MAG: hypothetical protein Q4F74_02810 [Synergistaceae bacterium]|nr:hypothetical protein [Synergistaceae bacterium]